MGSPARRNLSVSQSFGDDASGYFTERLDPALTRAALAAVLHRAAKIGREPSERQPQRVTQRQNCCPKLASVKLPKLLVVS